MKIRHFVWLLVLAMVLSVNNAFGQTEQRLDFSSDRPSFTTGPNLMDPGAWQLELGYTYRGDAGDGNKDVGSFPESLVRYGLNDRIELRFGWDGYDFIEDTRDRAGDTSLGIKYALDDDMLGLGTDGMALIATVSVPTGSGQSELDPSFILSWTKELDDVSMLTGNFGIGFPSDEGSGNRFTQGTFSLMYSREMGEATTVFGEYFTNFPAVDDEDAEHVLQSGIMHMIGPNTQLDFRVGVGLNDQADDWIVGVGVVQRF